MYFIVLENSKESARKRPRLAAAAARNMARRAPRETSTKRSEVSIACDKGDHATHSEARSAATSVSDKRQ
jgi:hypothetical protein